MSNLFSDAFSEAHLETSAILQTIFLGRLPEDLVFSEAQIHDAIDRIPSARHLLEKADTLRVVGEPSLLEQKAQAVMEHLVPEQLEKIGRGKQAILGQSSLTQSAEIFLLGVGGNVQSELKLEQVHPEFARQVRHAKFDRMDREHEAKLDRNFFRSYGAALCRGLSCALSDAASQQSGLPKGNGGSSDRAAYFQLFGEPKVGKNWPAARFGVIDLGDVLQDAMGDVDLKSVPIFDGSDDSQQLLREVHDGINRRNQATRKVTLKLKGSEGWSGDPRVRVPEQYL